MPLLLSIMILSSGSIEASDWPFWRGPNRNGISSGSGCGIFHGCLMMVLANGKIYVRTSTGDLVCVDVS